MDAASLEAAPPAKKYKKVDNDLKKPRKLQLQLLGKQAYEDKLANGGRLPDGYYKSIVENPNTLRLCDLLSISRDDLRNELRRIEKAAKKGKEVSTTANTQVQASSNGTDLSNTNRLIVASSNDANATTDSLSNAPTEPIVELPSALNESVVELAVKMPSD